VAEALGASSNFENRTRLRRLAALAKHPSAAIEGNVRGAEAVFRPRQPVLNVATAVLLEANQPLQKKEVHEAAERLSRKAVSWSSVRNCLADHSDGRKARFERVGWGRYRLREVANDDRSV
jgi:hypothetical protein